VSVDPDYVGEVVRRAGDLSAAPTAARIARTAALLRPWWRRVLADRQAALGVDAADVGAHDDPVEPLARQGT
jgi:hypothetical protein